MYEEIYCNGVKVNELHYPEGVWTQAELIALERLRQKYSYNHDQDELPPVLRRLEFLRWLIANCKLTGDTSVGDLTNEDEPGTLVGEHVG